MATSVDTKIVELKFNNDNFKEKVESTLQGLQKMNKDIEAIGNTKAFEGLGKSAKNVDFSTIQNGVEETTKGFSKLEISGMAAIANLTNSVVNFGKRIATSLISPLKEGVMAGGLARARNIEQATFSFEGQKIGQSKASLAESGGSYYKEVMDAVLGTSYSYDVAAKAASQLAASNVGVEKSMKSLASGAQIETKVLNTGMTRALLGIAGVAAMTGSNFDDISQIFTRVAGQGRLMANDLNSIASRGLNASAVLAKYLNDVNSGAIEVDQSIKDAIHEFTTSTEITEGDLRDFVSDSKISFEMFSDAMTRAFGDHAKDSTLTFQGALDDVNAALARIGADFYGPALNAGRDILNSVTPLVDVIHGKLNPALSTSGNLMDVTSKKLSQYLDMFSYTLEMFPNKGKDMTGWIKEHMNAWTNIADLYKKGNLEAAVGYLKDASKAWESVGEHGIDAYKMIGDYLKVATDKGILSTYLTKKTPEQIDALVEKGELSAKQMKKVVNGLVQDGEVGFNTMYKAFHKLWSEDPDLLNSATINEDFNEYLRTLINAGDESLKFTRNIDTMFRIMGGGVSIVKSTWTILGNLADIFLTIARHLTPLGHLLVETVKQLAQFSVYAADFIATSPGFAKVIDSIIAIINRFFELMNVSKLAQAALLGISKVFDFLAKAIDKVQAGIGAVAGAIRTAFDAIADRIEKVLSSSQELANILTSLRKAALVSLIINFAAALAKPVELMTAFVSATQNASKGVTKIIKAMTDVFTSIAGLVGSFKKVLDEVTNALKRMQELIVATAILEIALAMIVLAGALYLLSKVNAKGAAEQVTLIAGALTILASLLYAGKALKSMTSVRKVWEKGLNDLRAVGLAMVEFAASVAILAGAIYALAKLDPNRMWQALAAIEILLITLAGVAKFLSGTSTTTRSTGLKALWSGETTKTTTNMTKGLLSLVAVAEAVNILSKALARIATIQDPATLWQALGAIEAMLVTMTIMVKVLSAEKADKMVKGIGGLLAMALAIRMLTKPIKILAELSAIDNDALWNAITIIGLVMAGMTAIVKYLASVEGSLKGAGAILIMAFALKTIGAAIGELTQIAQFSSDALWNAFSVIALALTAMALALGLLPAEGVIKKAAAYVVMAKALQMLGGVLETIAALGDSAWNALALIGAGLFVLYTALVGFKKVPISGILKLFLTLELGAVVLASFGAAVGVFGVGVGVLGAGLAVLAAGVTQAKTVGDTLVIMMFAFVAAIALLSATGLVGIGVILALGGAFLLLGIGMMGMGTGLANMATAIELLNGMKDEFKDLAVSIGIFIGKLKKFSGDAESIGESMEKISKPFYSIRKSVTTLVESIENLTKGWSDAIQKTSSSMQTLANALTRISRFNTESFGKSTEAVKAFIESLKGMNTDATAIANKSKSIADALGEMDNVFGLLKDSVDQFKWISVDSLAKVSNSLRAIAVPLGELLNYRPQLKGLADDILAFVQNLTKMGDNTPAVQEASTQLSLALNDVNDAVKLVKENFQGLTSLMGNTLSLIGSGLVDIGKGFNHILKVKDQLPEAAASITDFYDRLGQTTKLADKLSTGTKAITTAIKDLGAAAKKTADLSADGMKDSGKKMVEKLVEGIKPSKVETAVQKVVDAGVKKIKTKANYDAFYQVGEYLIKGLVKGIASQQDELETEVQKLEQKAERAVKAKAEIKSPSRVWMKIGSYMGEGLAIGIRDSASTVMSAATGLAYVSEKAISKAIDSISDNLDDDMNLSPVITPVVDLSDVDSGIDYIASSFGAQGLGFGSIRGTRLAASIDATNQNGRLERELHGLSKQMSAMTDSMNSRTLNVYNSIDGSTDPNAFADDLIRSFRLKARTV